MRRRSYAALKKELVTQEKFDEFAGKIAQKYAYTELEYARKRICEDYNLTSNCYYRLLEHAVVESLVDDVTMVNIMNKSANNQANYYEGSGMSSVAKYARLYDARCKKIANNMETSLICEIANDFSSGKSWTSKYRLACKNDVSTRVIDYALEIAILEDMIPDDEKVKIGKRLIKTTKKDDRPETEKYVKRLGIKI